MYTVCESVRGRCAYALSYSTFDMNRCNVFTFVALTWVATKRNNKKKYKKKQRRLRVVSIANIIMASVYVIQTNNKWTLQNYRANRKQRSTTKNQLVSNKPSKTTDILTNTIYRLKWFFKAIRNFQSSQLSIFFICVFVYSCAVRFWLPLCRARQMTDKIANPQSAIHLSAQYICRRIYKSNYNGPSNRCVVLSIL